MPLDYTNKVILAPMVRIGTLPIRLLSLQYGADIVYTEELIDYKLLQCKRIENTVLGTVDFVWSDGSIIYRTCPQEKGRVVLQLGTSDAKRAVQVAKMVEKDVDGIDVNMGCPKEFSIKGGMGAALLKQPDKAKEILTSLVQAVSVPVTCKIRLLDTIENTLAFVRVVQDTGIAAIALHGRRKEERPRHHNHNDLIKRVAEECKLPVIANGGSKEITDYPDIERFRRDTGASSVMIARRAQWNPSIFRPEGRLPTDQVIRDYLGYALDYNSHEMNVKYCMQQLYREEMDTPRGQSLQAATKVRDMCALWDMAGHYDDVLARHQQREAEQRALLGDESALRKRKLDDGSEIVEMAYKYCRKEYRNASAPKMVLYVWTDQHGLTKPQYITTQNPDDRTFTSIVIVDGNKYGSSLWEKSKKVAEQAAAAVCLVSLGIWSGNHDDDSRDDNHHGNHDDQTSEAGLPTNGSDIDTDRTPLASAQTTASKGAGSSVIDNSQNNDQDSNKSNVLQICDSTLNSGTTCQKDLNVGETDR